MEIVNIIFGILCCFICATGLLLFCEDATTGISCIYCGVNIGFGLPWSLFQTIMIIICLPLTIIGIYNMYKEYKEIDYDNNDILLKEKEYSIIRNKNAGNNENVKKH